MRVARQHVPGVVHHLIWRFIDGRYFFDIKGARSTYLSLFARAMADSDWKCIAYALMSNHIHIATVAGRSPLSEWSRRVNLPFATWINERKRRIGPVFADRAKDRAFAPTSVPALVGYIHNNPVRASVVGRAAESHWTSHPAYVGAAPVPTWLHAKLGLKMIEMRPAAFDRFVDGQPPEPEAPETAKILKVARKHARANAATPFERQVPLVIRPFGRVRADPNRVVQLASAIVGVEPEMVASHHRDKTLQLARIVAIHSGVAIGISGADMATALSVSQQTVSRIVRYAPRPTSLCERVYAQLMRELRPDE